MRWIRRPSGGRGQQRKASALGRRAGLSFEMGNGWSQRGGFRPPQARMSPPGVTNESLRHADGRIDGFIAPPLARKLEDGPSATSSSGGEVGGERLAQDRTGAEACRKQRGGGGPEIATNCLGIYPPYKPDMKSQLPFPGDIPYPQPFRIRPLVSNRRPRMRF